MYLFPNGLNIQIFSGAMRRAAKEAENPPVVNIKAPPTESDTSDKTVLRALKDVAPHLNRHQRRAKLAEIRTKAKNEAAALAKKEIAKQQKEKNRG